MNKPDIPPELVQLCDPWLQHLWGLRGTYAGTQIDWPFHEQPCSPTGETGGKVKQKEAPCQTSASAPATAVSDP